MLLHRVRSSPLAPVLTRRRHFLQRDHLSAPLGLIKQVQAEAPSPRGSSAGLDKRTFIQKFSLSLSLSLNTIDTESQNHTVAWVGREHKSHSPQLPAVGRDTSHHVRLLGQGCLWWCLLSSWRAVPVQIIPGIVWLEMFQMEVAVSLIASSDPEFWCPFPRAVSQGWAESGRARQHPAQLLLCPLWTPLWALCSFTALSKAGQS